MKTPKNQQPKQAKKQSPLSVMANALRDHLIANKMTKTDSRSLSSARYRAAEYWFCRGYIAAMKPGKEKEFVDGFMSMMNMSGRSILEFSV